MGDSYLVTKSKHNNTVATWLPDAWLQEISHYQDPNNFLAPLQKAFADVPNIIVFVWSEWKGGQLDIESEKA